MTADSSDPRSASRAPAAPPRPAPVAPDAPSANVPAEPASCPEDGARTPAEYTDPPGHHRRPSDGAALDVGG